MEIEKTIEKIKTLKSEIDAAFDEGKIDLDRISAGLESVVVDLKLLCGPQKEVDRRPGMERGIDSSRKRFGCRPSFRVQDYR